jgi:hypothetical protein
MERQPTADQCYSALMPAAWITLLHLSAEAGCVAAGPRHAFHKAAAHRITDRDEHDRDRAVRLLQHREIPAAGHQDDFGREREHLHYVSANALCIPNAPAVIDRRSQSMGRLARHPGSPITPTRRLRNLEVAVGNFSRATGAGAEIDQTPSARHGIEFSIFEARRSVRSSLVVSVVCRRRTCT